MTIGEHGEAQSHQTERKHVVVINRSPEYMDFIRLLLQDENYNVTTTNFVPHTFDRIAGLQPDLIIVDLTTGQTDGWNLLASLQDEAATRDIPILLISTDPDVLARVRREPERFGIRRALLKPMELDALFDAVHETIGHA